MTSISTKSTDVRNVNSLLMIVDPVVNGRFEHNRNGHRTMGYISNRKTTRKEYDHVRVRSEQTAVHLCRS